MATRMQQRRGTAAEWTSANPVLAAGEIGFESDTNTFKVGDGSTTWDSLSYFKNVSDVTGEIVGLAPEALDTLQELSAALGDDPDFLTNISATVVQETQPESPNDGQFWYDVNNSILYVYTGTEWVEAGGASGGASVTASATAPEAPETGNLWWDTDSGNLYIYYDDGTSAQWVAANGPQVFVGTSAPAGYQGQLWFDSTQGKTYIYYDDGTSAQWVSAIGGSLSGNVIQVVSTTKTDTFSASVTSGGTTDVTGLTASITPKSTSSKILILATVSGDGGDAFAIYPTSGGSVITSAVGDSASPRGRIFSSNADDGPSTQLGVSASINFLDSPATTSSVTYGIGLFNVSGATQTLYVNRTAGDGANAYVARSASTITLMEIAG